MEIVVYKGFRFVRERDMVAVWKGDAFYGRRFSIESAIKLVEHNLKRWKGIGVSLEGSFGGCSKCYGLGGRAVWW